MGENTLKNIAQPVHNVLVNRHVGAVARLARDHARDLEQLLSEPTPSFTSATSSYLTSMTSSYVVTTSHPIEHKSSSSSSSNSSTSKFVDSTTESIPVEESILTLLNKVYLRVANVTAYVPKHRRTGTEQPSVFSGSYYLCRLLDAICESSPESARYAEGFYVSQNRSPGKGGAKVDVDEK